MIAKMPRLRSSRASSRTGSPLNIRVVLYAALAIVAAAVPSAAALLPSPARVAVDFIFVLFGPGTAVTGWLSLRTPVAEVLIATVLSLVITTAAGEVMLTLHAWSPEGYAAVVAPIVVIMLVRHVVVRTLVRPRSTVGEATDSR